MAKPAPTFYVFHGADEFTRAETLADFKRRLGPPDTVDLNTTLLDGSRLTLAKLRHACDAVPFLAEKRLVMVFVEVRPLPAQHPILQLAQREEEGYAKRFDPPDTRALPRWIEQRVRRHGGRIEPRATRQLAAVIGGDLRLLDQEIAKLAIYTAAERAITTADVDAVVPYAQAAIVFDLVDALGRRDGRTAAQTLHRLLDAGEHPLGLLGMIVRQFRLLAQVQELKAEGATPRDVAQALRLHPFPARKLYNQATHFTAAQLETVYRHLLDTDVAIKSGEIEAEVALDLLVAGLAERNA